jgi:serine/threonine-protein kinase
VLEAFTQKWAQLPEQKRRVVELLDRARLDFEAGQFFRAESRARQARSLAEADRNAAVHADYAALLVHLYRETGRPGEAAKVAEAYLQRKDVWPSSDSLRTGTMLMLRSMLHVGALSKEAFETKRAEWMEQSREASDANLGDLWFFAHADGIERPEEADEAIAAFGKLPPGSLSKRTIRLHGERLGKMYLLAGRVDEALPFLLPENQPCRAPGDGHALSFYLGLAREQKGDKDGACAAYAKVLAPWGKARPRSVTADQARARARALGCARR